MSANTDLISRVWYEELWDKWNVAVLDDAYATDYRLHLPGQPGPVDRNTAKQVVTMFGQAFPDLTHTVDEMIAEGNTVAARWTVQGTHRGDFQGIAPTNKPIRLSGATVHHIADGRIVETWLVFDTMALLQQLGAVPQAAQE